MTDAIVRKLAAVLSVEAEIQGMIVDNKIRESKGLDLLYSEGDFKRMSSHLLSISNSDFC